MTSIGNDLSALTRGGAGGPAPAAAVPRPAARWRTRVLVPAAVLLSVAGLLSYSARAALWPRVAVRVLPVVLRDGGAGVMPGGPRSEGTVLLQAPGWIEADPYAVTVPALAEGVVREVLVLEGDHVEAGQTVARLVDDEARLRVRRAEAELAEHRAGIIRAQARVRVEAARAEELRGELERRRGLVAAGGVSTGEIANIGLKLATQEHELEVAQAEVAQADAAAERVGVLRDEAALALDRMEVRSPAAGVVLNRLVGPGSRLSMAGSNAGAGSDAMSGAVLRLYDPAKLQVRVDIPLAEAAKVGVGAVAAIVTEAMPGRSFSGRVTRVVHEANIQRNTVQVKVAIDDSDPILKPEMLTRVRFMAAADSAHTGTATPGWADAQGTAGMWAPTSGLTATGDGVARAWVIDHRGGAAGTVAEGREVRVLGEAEGGYTPVGPVEGDGSRGLRPGDRVIIDAPAGLKAGTRVDVSEDDSTGGPAAEGE